MYNLIYSKFSMTCPHIYRKYLDDNTASNSLISLFLNLLAFHVRAHAL